MDMAMAYPRVLWMDISMDISMCGYQTYTNCR